jgi:hypothetical protein
MNLNIDKFIRISVKPLKINAKSETELVDGNRLRKWWFTDERNILISRQEGMTDEEALQWVADKVKKGLYRLHGKMKKNGDGEK